MCWKSVTQYLIYVLLTSGSGGRLANKGGTLSQYVVQQLVVQKEDPYEDNPREAILRHAKVAEENPLYVAPAYKKLVLFSMYSKISRYIAY